MKSLLKFESGAMILGLFLFATLFSYADDFKYSDSWGKQGFSLTTQKTSGVEVNYSIQSFTLSKDMINGEAMDVISLPGNLLPNNEGAPNLPGESRFLAIPNGAMAKFKVSSSRTETFKNVEMSPAFRIPWDTENGPLEFNKDQNIYLKNEFYPANPVMLSEVMQLRGVDAVMLGITPFQYNPVTKELIVYRDLKVNVEFEGGTGYFGNDRLRSRWWDPILSDALLNYESLPKMNYNKSYQATDETGCEYLIITPNGAEFIQWADSIKKFRTQQGIKTDIVTLGDIGGNNANTIENYINNAYNTWDIVPAACLLLADYGTNAANSITSPMWDNYCVSDNIYSDINNDYMPEIVFARITAQNAAQLQVMVTKFLNYERNPPTAPYFYSHPITALGFQTERWFQICSEAVAGFWENIHDKSTVRVNKTYQGNPMTDPWSTATNTTTVVNIFGPNGLGYIPSTPAQVNCTWNGSANDVVVAINNGSFMLQHRDHGFESGWGEPAFTSTNINSLTNTNLTFVWSINCLTGKYNLSSECFAEKFHRYTYNGQNAGALGLNAASEVSYSFVNDAYAWGAFDNMWPEFLPTYGSTPTPRGILPAFSCVAGKYFLQASSWPYNTGNKAVTYNLFHHHGDAFMTVYSEIPTNLTVVHNPILYAGVTSFDITANVGALIALTVNGEIIATATGTGSPLSISIPGQVPPNHVLVTVTKQNYYRYSSLVEVIPPAGPYIVQHGVEINDAAGNGNGIMETSEAILASITVKNVGVENASNVVVTISTNDQYVTITDPTEPYGTIAAGATAIVSNGFAWQVANNIPDMHSVNFLMSATDGTNTWTTYFNVVGHGPDLAFGSLTINDSQGNNNGRLDPGETANVIIPTYNNGSYHAIGAIGTLGCSSGFITLNNVTHNFNVIGAGLMENAIFNVTVAPNAPVGTPVAFMFDVTAGGYNLQQNFAATIGLIVEDWETGDLTQFAWQTGGNSNWAISTTNPYEGTYSIKSGALGNSQSNYLSLQYDIFSADSISFWFKVSSEANYDFLKFLIDNVEKASWSGEVGWARVAYPVTAGTHTFKWTYSKDVSVASGSDCAWLDFIVLPAPPMTTAYAGLDGATCEGNTYSCTGSASLYNVVNWSSSGTGTFDNPQILNPVYTPGESDINNGSVILTLTAYGPDNNVSDNMTLTIHKEPVSNAGDDAVICSNSSYELVNAVAENYISVVWSTSGDGTFDDNQIIHPVYTPGANDLSTGSVELTFTVNGNVLCGSDMDAVMLTFEAAAEAFAGSETATCSDEPITLGAATAANYSSVSWTTSGDGTFNDITSLNPVYTPGANDASAGSVTLTLSAMGNGTCPEVTSEMMVTVHAVATAFAGQDHQVTSGESYTITDAIANNYTSIVWTTSGDGTFSDESILNPVYTPGVNDIAAQQATLTLTAGNENCGEVSDAMTLVVNTSGIIENLAGFNVSISPNPNHGSFTLELNGNRNELINIRIFNAQSKLVYEAENIMVEKVHNQTIQLNVEQGIYFIRIEGVDLLVNRKIIINK
jgi:hypothetical protein